MEVVLRVRYSALCAVLWWCGTSATSLTGVVLNNTLTIGYLIPWSHEWPVGPTSGSAITLGIQEVQRRGLLPGYNIEWAMRDSWCEPYRGFRVAVEVWSSSADLDMILGAGCSVVCQPVSLLTEYWNIPIVSYSCTSGALSDKLAYPTFTRSIGTWLDLGPVFNAVMDNFGWNRVGVIATTHDVMLSTAVAARDEMIRQGKVVIYRAFSTAIEGSQINEVALALQREVIRDIKDEVRILLFVTYALEVRNLLIICHDEGMMDGNYAFIAMDVNHMPNEPQTYRPELDDVIWQGVINGLPRTPSGEVWDTFCQDVIDAFQDPVWDSWDHLEASASVDEVDVYSGMIYEAVLMWAHGVNLTLQQGGSADDGLLVTRNIINMTFPGLDGMVAISENGDRKTDQSITIFQDGVFVPIMVWWAANGAMEILYNSSAEETWAGITWAANSSQVPLDSPVCGWRNEFCHEDVVEPTSFVLGITFAVLIGVVTLVAGLLLYRRKRYIMSLHDARACIIPWVEVRNLNMGYSRSHDLRERSEKTKELDSDVFMYKRVRVAVTQASLISNLGEDKLMIEISKLRSLVDENIAKFVGIVLDSETKYVITENATRGTLYDLIGSDDTFLIRDFKISMLSDIVNGMRYLHGSILGLHGSLTSKGCVIGSRWQCKISNYWINNIESRPTLNDQVTLPIQYEDYMWSAPEILQNGTKSNKCDVYSFAIIIQEIMMEDRPYAGNIPALDPKNIVHHVRKYDADNGAYRPHIPEETPGFVEGWRKLAQTCWVEDPEKRPSFSHILEMLTALIGGQTVNLADSIARRLEAHTRHLEKVVAERTEELAEEQEREESLLCELLPRSVFNKLKTGQHVAPEIFDEVSIFISDIVSFTRISSLASPLQVVSLLNRLYSICDAVVRDYDVYKVATIGDAYMVASGLPERNGRRHAGEICAMALSLIDSIQNFEIGHIPGEKLRLRIGVHTGPCVAGVTGLKTPRYLLFGDTVNTASHIEALGAPMEIHVSQTTREIVEDENCFLFEPNQDLDIPGYGTMSTSWLIGFKHPADGGGNGSPYTFNIRT